MEQQTHPLENPSCKFRSIVLVQLLTANHSQLWFADLFCCAYDWGVSGKTPPEPDEAASSGRSMTLACVPANINQYWISTLTSLRNAYLPKSPPPDRDNPIFQGTFESSVIILVFFHFGALDPENRPTLPRRPQKPSQRRDQIPRLSISLVLCYASSFDRQPGPAQHSHDLKCGP